MRGGRAGPLAVAFPSNPMDRLPVTLTVAFLPPLKGSLPPTYPIRSRKNARVRSHANRAASASYSGRFSSKNQCLVPAYL